ncbi:MAG: type 1 glutamine amidotransferase [Pseudomonadota bacterium]
MTEMTIGILETGPVMEPLLSRHGSYPQMMERLLAGHGFRFRNWRVLDGEFPDAVDDADGWLITGSRHGAYDNLPWIATLETFLREAFAAHVPIVGICFGHQILAQALGGTVVKFDGGWSLGRQEYHIKGFDRPLEVIGFHQDQVIEAPEGAEIVGSSEFCRIAALAYGDRAWTLQPHPEFGSDFVADLFEQRRDLLPGDLVEEALKTLDGAYDDQTVAGKMAAVFRTGLRAAPAEAATA